MICASESPPQSLPAVDENVDDLARMRGRRRYDQIGPAPGGNAASVPIPKFAYTPGTLSGELRNQRDTSKSMILVPLLNPKFAIGLLARLCELRVRGTSIAESAFAAVLAASAITIVLNEGFANWQALWLAAVFIALAVSLTRARDAPG